MSVIAKGISKLFKPKRRRGPKSKAKSEEQIKVIGQERESKPVQKTPNRKREVEGARLDPDASDYTGGVGARTARDVGTRGEKVTIGGLTINNFVRDQASEGMKARGKAKAKLAELAREGKTPEIRKEAQAAYNKMERQDIKATNKARQTAKQTSEKPKVKERLKAAYKGTPVKKQDKRDPVQAFLNDGEIIGNFNPTVNQQKQAVSSLKARGKTKKAREIEAMLELGPKKAAKQKTKEMRISNRRKIGGKVKRKAGGNLDLKAVERGKMRKTIQNIKGTPAEIAKDRRRKKIKKPTSLPNYGDFTNELDETPNKNSETEAQIARMIKGAFDKPKLRRPSRGDKEFTPYLKRKMPRKKAGGKVKGYKKGGPITYRMSGGQVVGNSYD